MIRNKRGNKKGISAILVAIAICTCIAANSIGVVSTPAAPTAIIVPPSQEVMTGAQFNVSVLIDPGDNHTVPSGSVILAFNASVIEAETAIAGDLWVSPDIVPGFPKIDNTNGTVRIDIYDLSHADQTPPGNFTVVAFAVKENASAGTYNLNLSAVGLMDENGQEITGVIVTNGTVTIKKYPRWDINEDGVVDYKDLGILIVHYGEETNPPYPRCDINEDGTVDYKDLGILIVHYGEEY